MDAGLALQLKNIITMWLFAGNGLLALWAGALFVLQRPPNRTFFNILAFLQALVVLVFAIGVFLVLGPGRTNPGHIMYGVLNVGLAAVRMAVHGRLAGGGRSGAAWHALLALLAIALLARSFTTALLR